MLRLTFAAIMSLGLVGGAKAGEFDNDATAKSKTSTLPPVVAIEGGSEMDKESPTQAHRWRGWGWRGGWGWGGGWRGGWGGSWGWSSWRFSRPWGGYGWGGWGYGRPWGGYGWGWGGYYPRYYSSYYTPFYRSYYWPSYTSYYTPILGPYCSASTPIYYAAGAYRPAWWF
jgi:hypothetical protein